MQQHILFFLHNKTYDYIICIADIGYKWSYVIEWWFVQYITQVIFLNSYALTRVYYITINSCPFRNFLLEAHVSLRVQLCVPYICRYISRDMLSADNTKISLEMICQTYLITLRYLSLIGSFEYYNIPSQHVDHFSYMPVTITTSFIPRLHSLTFNHPLKTTSSRSQLTLFSH